MDRQRFVNLWSRCAAVGNGADDLFDEVACHYAEPHRRYHTTDHVSHCLTQFDAARPHMADPDAVELAVWYHDVIYDVGAADNEARSASLFEVRADGAIAPERIAVVHDLIMVTVHTKVAPTSSDQAYMVDIDLSSFGLPWSRFLSDSVAVRDEFPHMPDQEFYPKQRNFLTSLLAREHFCYTAFFRARHERRARSNIERYLRDLQSKGLL